MRPKKKARQVCSKAGFDEDARLPGQLPFSCERGFNYTLLGPRLAQRQGFVDPFVSLSRHVSISACALAE